MPKLLFCLAALAGWIHAQTPVRYHLRYTQAASESVHVIITLPEPVKAPATLVMPRTYPGGYEQVPYDAFVSGVAAFAVHGESLSIAKDADGPRWNLGKPGEQLARVEYRVDIARMEAQIADAVSTSKIRPAYAGMLGYSVFAYVEGFAETNVQLQIEAPAGWPVLTTLAPSAPPPVTSATATAPGYYALADSQILIGPGLHVRRFDGKIPLIMAIYAEGAVDESLEGRLAREALDRVQEYFGDTPFPQYTVQLELLRPLPGHDYNFSQEHLDSGTFSLSVDAAITSQTSVRERDRTRFNYAHHMAHCWIPKRAYGTGYRPFTWEMTPVIDTIWFNEGFGRYAAIQAVAAGMPAPDAKAFRDGQLANLRRIVDSAAPFLRRMSLPVLSREASFLYAVDFRTGSNVFS